MNLVCYRNISIVDTGRCNNLFIISSPYRPTALPCWHDDHYDMFDTSSFHQTQLSFTNFTIDYLRLRVDSFIWLAVQLQLQKNMILVKIIHYVLGMMIRFFFGRVCCRCRIIYRQCQFNLNKEAKGTKYQPAKHAAYVQQVDFLLFCFHPKLCL
jgi:hypothetical protein